MTSWRMAFRDRDGGYEMWPQCLSLEVAAITYSPLTNVDLSKYPQGEPKQLWAKLFPSQKYSLRQIAYVMKKGDVIYAKQGSYIVGKGIVKGSYQFDATLSIVDSHDTQWAHQIPVKWQSNFVAVKISLGDQPRYTVRKLSESDLSKLEAETKVMIRKEALEGQAYRKEATFRRRNRALIQAKKANSDYCCEVCTFNFERTYGSIGREYIIAHHIEPLFKRSSQSKTELKDIALLCGNCHAIVHTKNPPLSPEQLRKLLRLKPQHVTKNRETPE